VLDTATNRLLSTIAIPPGPHGLVVTPDGASVFASSDGDSKVSVIVPMADVVSGTV
jgi:DNA-binding beta-propeller fold protein YncE